MNIKSLILGSAAALAVIYGASAAPVDTVIAPNVAASTTKLPTQLDRAPKCGPQLAVLETLTSVQFASNETGPIRQVVQRPIIRKTMLASTATGVGSDKLAKPILLRKPNLPAPALGGTTVI